MRSRERLSYPEAQARIDAERGDPLELLREVGLARIQQERDRGGASLNVPDEEIVRTADGGYALERRRLLPVEDWNAQLSLMTGMAAAELMLEARVGILRTMPGPTDERIAAFRTQTVALGHPWTDAIGYGEYLRGLDRDDPASLAIMQAAAGLFRGAGYEAMDGEAPADPVQSALAAPYAHVTAPLRRLVDRWGLVVCEALSSGREVPRWARDSLHELPSLMGASSQRASRLEAASVARVEAAVLSGRVGERFVATVLEVRGEDAVIQLVEPAVTATCPAVAGGARRRPDHGRAAARRHPGRHGGLQRRLRSDVLVVVFLVLHREVIEVGLGRIGRVPGCLVGALIGALMQRAHAIGVSRLVGVLELGAVSAHHDPLSRTDAASRASRVATLPPGSGHRDATAISADVSTTADARSMSAGTVTQPRLTPSVA